MPYEFTKVIVYTRPDGGVDVMYPVDRLQVLDTPAQYEDRQVAIARLNEKGERVREVTMQRVRLSVATYRLETEDEVLERLFARLPKDAINPAIILESNVPRDRSKRAEWRHEGGLVKVGKV